MQSFENKKSYNDKYKTFINFIYKNGKYLPNFKTKSEKIEMVCYIWLYYRYISSSSFLKIKEKKWQIDYIKKYHREEYEKYLTRIKDLDNLLFEKIFKNSYEQISEDDRVKISLKIQKFIINDITEELFLEFSLSLGREFEFFFYLYFEQIINNKNFWEWNKWTERFLDNKCKDLSKLYVELSVLK